MLIDGNDDRGIDVGLLTRDQFPITRMRSHVDDLSPNGEALFSRDCPEYELVLPGGKTLLVLVNHFKSKGHGTRRATTQGGLPRLRAQPRSISVGAATAGSV
jgi:hypothetical protein